MKHGQGHTIYSHGGKERIYNGSLFSCLTEQNVGSFVVNEHHLNSRLNITRHLNNGPFNDWTDPRDLKNGLLNDPHNIFKNNLMTFNILFAEGARTPT